MGIGVVGFWFALANGCPEAIAGLVKNLLRG